MLERKKFMCHGCGVGYCGLEANIEDGRLVDVKWNPEMPYGMKCDRYYLDDDGKPLVDLHYHKDRVNFPLRRAGERGDGKWQRVSWDESLEEVAGKLKVLSEKYGPESLVILTGTAHMPDNTWTPWRFCCTFGTPNKLGHESICYGPMVVTDEIMFGWSVCLIPRPVKLVVFARNLAESVPPIWHLALQNKQNIKTKWITIDPRMTETARNSDLWLQIRPGTDAALLMCWINHIVQNRLYDKDFILKWTNSPFLVMRDEHGLRILRETDLPRGQSTEKYVVWNDATNSPAIWNPQNLKFEENDVRPALSGNYSFTLASGRKVQCSTAWDMLIERVEDFTPETTEKITWIPADQIVQSAMMYATIKPAQFIVAHLYDNFAPGSIDVHRCRRILATICGHVGEGESVVGPIPYFVNEYEMELKVDERLPQTQKKKMIGFEKSKLISYPGYDLKSKYLKRVWGISSNAMWSCQPHPPALWRAVLTGKPYPPKALIIAAANPLNKFSNAKLVYKAMKEMELIIVFDMFITPTAAIADYVFPAADFMERPNLNIGFGGIFPFYFAGERAVGPEFERRNDYDFFKGLASKLGLGKYWRWGTLEEAYDYRVRPESGLESFRKLVVDQPYSYLKVDPKQYESNGFATPSRRIEIYSIILEELGHDPMPKYAEPFFSPISRPTLAKEYPLMLVTTTRHLPFYHSEHRHIQHLRERHPDPIVEMHPSIARSAKPPIFDGDWVWIETHLGRVKQRARLSWGIHPKVVAAQHCWWFPEKPEAEPSLHGVWESNINVCTEDDPDLCDPVYGSWPNLVLCKIRKAESPL